jgi:NitT/TauT family transport system permease protein/putative hydroxymethylpyrimidine transport system permease protein
MSALALVLAALGAWEAVVRAGAVDALILPAPTQIATALWEDRSLLASDLAVTAGEVLAGLALALLAGTALAVAMHLLPAVRRMVGPLVIGSQAVPIPVVAPLLILVLGFGVAPKVLMVALVCFFPITIGLADGLRAVDADQRKVLRSFSAGRWRTFVLLEAPSALPQAFTGARIAAAVAVIGAVFAEWTGSSQGLGHLLITAGGQLETARVWAATVLLFALAIALYGAVALAERRLVTWKDPR